MSDDPGVRDMLKFNLARDTVPQNMGLAACEELIEDGRETPVVPSALFDEETQEHNGTIWPLSDGPAGPEGRWASGPAPDGMHEFSYLMEPKPLGDKGSAPKPDPLLYATSPENLGLIDKAIKKLT